MTRRAGPHAIVTRSPDETRELGRALGRALPAGGFVGLLGELGSGKTVLAQGIALGLGCSGVVSSPSFVIVNEYAGRVPVIHVDLYRLSDAGPLHELGYRELFYGEGVALVEWADRVPELLPKDRLDVSLELVDAEVRRVTLTATGPAHAPAVEAADRWASGRGRE
ncbi:MAG: tRNA (adenosine(37)-N6)-threonylcarbamoyltransferase complex ATPase subunit type 1 TsaE [Candidatus Eisenbacteria bacterium]|nr:tRNA (adenosine(37)-N6)-threonylcarbamoyltransferase complex ATPase subunit type 1 TsaE [Candidatus Eisenbacteria bacterium]